MLVTVPAMYWLVKTAAEATLEAAMTRADVILSRFDAIFILLYVVLVGLSAKENTPADNCVLNEAWKLRQINFSIKLSHSSNFLSSNAI